MDLTFKCTEWEILKHVLKDYKSGTGLDFPIGKQNICIIFTFIEEEQFIQAVKHENKGNGIHFPVGKDSSCKVMCLEF